MKVVRERKKGGGEGRKEIRKEENRLVETKKRCFQAETASLLRSSSLSWSLTFPDYFAIRERGEWRLLENERRGERRKKRKKERREQIVKDITEELSN